MYWKTLLESGESVPAPETLLVELLNPRELGVARLVAQGHSNSDIAALLEIATDTVARYTSNIYNTLGFSNRVEVAFRVLRENFFFYQHRHSPAA